MGNLKSNPSYMIFFVNFEAQYRMWYTYPVGDETVKGFNCFFEWPILLLFSLPISPTIYPQVVDKYLLVFLN